MLSWPPRSLAEGATVRNWPLLMAVLMLGGCTHGPVVDASRFESAALMPDQRTVTLAYRVLRYRPAQGLAAFPDGGVPSYLDDRAVVAAVPVEGGRPRVLLRLPNTGVHGGHAVTLRSQDADPGHLLVGVSEQASTDRPSRLRWSRLSLADGRRLAYPDLQAELERQGRRLGSPEFGDIRVLDPDGDLLIGARGAAGDELWLRPADGGWRLIDPIKHFYGVRGDELYYWSGDEAVVKNWRTFARRVIARYDPQLRQTSRLIADDPTARALDRAQPAPDLTVSVPMDGSAVILERRGARAPIAVDLAALRD